MYVSYGLWWISCVSLGVHFPRFLFAGWSSFSVFVFVFSHHFRLCFCFFSFFFNFACLYHCLRSMHWDKNIYISIEVTPHLLNSKMHTILCVKRLCSRKYNFHRLLLKIPPECMCLCVCTISRLLSANAIQSLTKLMKTFHKPKINI